MGKDSTELMLSNLHVLGEFKDVSTDKLMSMTDDELEKLKLVKEIQALDVDAKCRMLQTQGMFAMITLLGEYMGSITDFMFVKPGKEKEDEI